MTEEPFAPIETCCLPSSSTDPAVADKSTRPGGGRVEDDCQGRKGLHRRARSPSPA
jgi:hypothetical protein